MALFSSYSKSRRIKGLRLVLMGVKLFKNSTTYTFYRHLGFPKILPKIAKVNITNKCDSRCKTCYVWSYYKKHPEMEKKEMKLEEFKKFVDNNPFLEDIMLTGGQLTLRDDIVDIWLYLDKKGYRTGGPTNAVDLKKIKNLQNKVLERLSGKNSHLLLLSIDGIGKEHDRLRGVRGEFKNAVNLLEWGLKKQKELPFLDVRVSHNITKSNYKNLPEFIEYMLNLGLSPSQISFRPAIFCERFENIGSKETLGSDKDSEIIEVLKEVKKRYKEYDNYFTDGTIKFLEDSKKLVIPCYAGYIIVYIDPYWNTYACMDPDTRIDNLKKTNFNLKPLWYGEEIKRIQDSIKHGRCYNCWNSCFAAPSMIANPVKIIKIFKENLPYLFKIR